LPFWEFRYIAVVNSFGAQLESAPGLNQLTLPDLWQQEAVTALRDGLDVVVHAPTGAGKTLIFELWSNQGKNRGQAIYTVPTRALANDKLAEWRARGWNVGIATGDLSENLDASIIVATLETQKNRLIRGDGPTLLVVDEYQMLGDADRGLNYELAMAMAPAQTQLLLLSGSVSNPQHVVKWLERLGRRATLIRHEVRPVPLEEVFANHLSWNLPRDVRGYWPGVTARALAEGLGPILLFAPRRQATETIAAELSRQLPNQHPLELTEEQRHLVGDRLAKMLKCRIAYHHSGMSYAVRAGVIEPLAKAGQLRVVVATMGLAAGINFSLRSVALAGESYRRDRVEVAIRPDEILQMAGRAGRRGIDETGYFLVGANGIRLGEGYAAHLARSGMVDWATLLGIMDGANGQGVDPFAAAVQVQERLFTTKPIHLGVESSLKHPNTPCGLTTDAERARHVRRQVRQMLNSRGEWEMFPKPTGVKVREIYVSPGRSSQEETVGAAIKLHPLLSDPDALENVGPGTLVQLNGSDGEIITYGRSITVADVLEDGRIMIAKSIRRSTGWKGKHASRERWQQKIVPLIEARYAKQNLPVIRFWDQPDKIIAVISLAEQMVHVPVDTFGVALWHPAEQYVGQPDCSRCSLIEVCHELPTTTGTALLWKTMGLVEPSGTPSRRGRVVSFFSAGVGLAIAAALEEETYPLDELIYDLANLDAGFRFCQEEDRFAGRLAVVCREAYGTRSVAGYLENGLPPKYGSGAETIVAGVHDRPASKHSFASDSLGDGDIDRVIIEWRSLMRQIAHAPELDWDRWSELKTRARAILNETESPTITELPALSYLQTQRIEHRLDLRRH
jgi:hypothetical protein